MRRFLYPIIVTLANAAPAHPQGTHVDADGVALPADAIARIGSMRLRHQDIVRGLAYSPSGTHIISIAEDETLRLWDAETGKLVRTTLVEPRCCFPPAL